MINNLSKKDIFLIKKYLSDYEKPKEEKTLSFEERQSLLSNIIDNIKSLLYYASEKNYGKYGEIYSEVEVGYNNLKRLIDSNIQIIKDALDLYILAMDEEIYLSLLDKDLKDMKGYEIEILYSFVKGNGKR